MGRLSSKQKKQLATLELELSNIILRYDIAAPFNHPVSDYKLRLWKVYNKKYNEDLIKAAVEKIEGDSLDARYEEEQDAIAVYLDKPIEGF